MNILDYITRIFYVRIFDDGTFELGPLLRNVVTSVDFSKIVVNSGDQVNLDVVRQAVASLSRYGNTPGYHGTIVVVADVTGNNCKLPLVRPADPNGVLYHPYPPYFVTDPEDFTRFLYNIACGEQHDGAVLVDRGTSQVLAYNLKLDMLPLKAIIQPRNNDNSQEHNGLRTDAARNYSKMRGVVRVYTASERGYMREYHKGCTI